MDADPPFDLAAEPDRLRAFIDELESKGFSRAGPFEWEGPIPRSLLDGGHTSSPTMTVIIRPSWPYLPPLLRVPGIAAWHADQERLCIWQADDNSQRWVTLQGLLDRIDEWAADAARGFAVVENARNPEIYWQETTGVVAGIVELDELLDGSPGDGQHGEFHFTDAVSADGRRSPVVVYDLRPGSFSAMTQTPEGVPSYQQVRGRWFFRKSVEHPPRTLTELRSFLTDKQRERLDKDLRDRALVMFGLFWRNQAGLVATVLLSSLGQSGERSYFLVALKPKGQGALLLRAGPDAHTLQQKSVAVLGVGAIGSYVADLLVRSGVGSLRLVDYDRLWPANLIRHAASPGTPAGMLKSEALKENLYRYPWVEINIPDKETDGLVWTIGGLQEILQGADLTIDATGHAGFAELAARVAEKSERPFVSVALFRGGAVARVRRQALTGDVPLLRRPHLDAYPIIPPLAEEAEYVGTETGCLAQIHNAPPVSVAHAAVLAVEVVIDHLAGRHDQPDEIIEVIRPGETPFDQVGRIRAEDLPVTIDVSERAQHVMREAARSALPNETGGVLLGCLIDGRAVVADAAEIVDPDATDCSYRVGEGRTEEIVSQARDQDSRVGYLGEWHSHPSHQEPSVRDLAAMLAAARESGTGQPALILIHPNEAAPGDLSVYVTTSAGLKSAAMCSTGDLPKPERTDEP